jgi:hypothetical protein
VRKATKLEQLQQSFYLSPKSKSRGLRAKNRTPTEPQLQPLSLFTAPTPPSGPFSCGWRREPLLGWLAVSNGVPPSGARPSHVAPWHGCHWSSGSHRGGCAASRRRCAACLVLARGSAPPLSPPRRLEVELPPRREVQRPRLPPFSSHGHTTANRD